MDGWKFQLLAMRRRHSSSEWRGACGENQFGPAMDFVVKFPAPAPRAPSDFM